MASQLLNRRKLHEQASQDGLPERAELDIGIALVPLPQEDTARCSRPSIRHFVHQQLIPLETAATLVESEEVLVADPRGGLTPAQMVEQKLLALLGGGSPGLFIQAAVRPDDIRRIPEP